MRLGKVFHNLDLSNYEYNYKDFKFIFSSKFYIEKFRGELYNYIITNSDKIIKKYSFIELDEFLALSLYKKIEKRGFKVYYKNLIINKDSIFKAVLK